MAKEVLRRLVERGNRDRQRQTDQAQSIKATQYIGNGYVQQIGQAPTRSRYLGNAGLVPGELVAPLGHGQQDVITHKKPVAFTASSQPQETIAIIPGSTIEIIYDSWTDKPADWVQYYDGGENHRIVWKNQFPVAIRDIPIIVDVVHSLVFTLPYPGRIRLHDPAAGFKIRLEGTTIIYESGFSYEWIDVSPDTYTTIRPSYLYQEFIIVYDTDVPNPTWPTNGNQTYWYTQTITIPSSGQERIVATGVDDVGYITFNGHTLDLTYPGTGFFSDYVTIEPGEHVLVVSVTDTRGGKAGIGFRIEYIPDIIYISEE